MFLKPGEKRVSHFVKLVVDQPVGNINLFDYLFTS